jgi:hypothetical protein
MSSPLQSYEDIENKIFAFLEARKRRPPIVKAIDELDRILWSGREHLEAWSDLYRAFKAPP